MCHPNSATCHPERSEGSVNISINNSKIALFTSKNPQNPIKQGHKFEVVSQKM